MSEHDDFERGIESLNEAMLDETKWPQASGLLDEACGVTGSGLLIADGADRGFRIHSGGFFVRGRRREDWERLYLDDYHATDEVVPRVRRLPFGRVARLAELYTPEELKTSSTYNEFLLRTERQDGLVVRLAGPGSCPHAAWGLGNPVARDGWGSDGVRMIQRLGRHVQQFMRVRHALAARGAWRRSLDELLNGAGLGVIKLDRRGKIVAANDRAVGILRAEDGLADHDGLLWAVVPEDRLRLDRLIANALPEPGRAAVSASMAVQRSDAALPLVVHVIPVSFGELELAVPSAGALVLIAEAGRQSSPDAGLVAEVLGLTPTETRLALLLAEGKTVADVARTTERKESSVYWHLRQIYAKCGIGRQVDLIRLVLSVDPLE